MEQNNCSTKTQKYKHLNEGDRYRIEALLQGKKSIKEIALILGRDRSTIYREVKRGTISRLQTDLSEKKQYRANVAQRDYVIIGKNKERTLKIGDDRRLEEYIRKKIIKDKYSPDAVIGEIKAKGLKFKGMICTKTLYNYIDAGIFSGISNKNLWEKRKRKKRSYKAIARISRTNRMARRISQRPEEINNRLLRKVKNPNGSKAEASRDRRLPIPGSMVTKIYKGNSLKVKVLEKGFEYEGKHYRTLSQVANVVTGNHWNGFLFFNL